MNRFFKSFHRPGDTFNAFGIHRAWPNAPINTYLYTDASTVEPKVQMGEHPKDAPSIYERYRVATLNHYSVRSREEFERKKLRGDGAKPANAYGENNKFNRFDTNDCNDQGIDKFAVSRRNLLAAYHADPVLAFLHDESCRRQFGEFPPPSGR